MLRAIQKFRYRFKIRFRRTYAALVVTSMVVVMWGVGVGAVIGISKLTGSNSGIIAIEGYGHAVIICGEALVVNSGHFEDEEIGDLVDLANETCPKED